MSFTSPLENRGRKNLFYILAVHPHMIRGEKEKGFSFRTHMTFRLGIRVKKFIESPGSDFAFDIRDACAIVLFLRKSLLLSTFYIIHILMMILLVFRVAVIIIYGYFYLLVNV